MLAYAGATGSQPLSGGRAAAQARLEQPWRTPGELAASPGGRQRAATESVGPAPRGLLPARSAGADVVPALGQSRGGFGGGACGLGRALQGELQWVPPVPEVPTRGVSCSRPGENAVPGN